MKSRLTARFMICICALIVVTFILQHSGAAFGCSRILWNNNSKAVVVSRSMDWEHHFGEKLIVYPRGLSLTGAAGENSAAWTSKYGSLAVIPFGFVTDKMALANLPKADLDPLIDGCMEGINEKGLTVHLLYLGPEKHEARDKRPGISYLRIMRYFLDNFKTVDEAVAGLDKVQVVPVKIAGIVIPAHYAFEDATGDSAILEFIDGKMKLYHGKDYRIMTNDPEYSSQLENLKQYKAFGGTKIELPGGVEPEDRFVRASVYLKTLPEPKDNYEAVAMVSGLIRNVSVPFGALYRSGPASTYPTWWVNATDITNRVLYFNWTLHPNVVWVDLKNLDFSGGAPIKVLDARDREMAGEVSKSFKPVRK